jgi:hypothetical protein
MLIIKKILFYLSIVAILIFTYNIFQILNLGFSSLSDFGLGALLGKIILLVISLFAAYKLKPQ